MEDLEKLLAEEEKETPKPASEEAKATSAEEKPDEELLKKEKIKANLDAAIREAQDELRRIRKEKQKVKTSEEEDLPRIDMDDPSAKAWDKHIREQVNPVQSELEQEKAEIFNFALKEFLSDKPVLASKPEKVKELITKYERIKESTGRTKEGVLTDLDSAYAATFHKEILEAMRSKKIAQAQADAIFSDIAVSRGATAYSSKEDSTVEQLTEEDRKILAKWNMSPQDWQEQRKKYK